MPPGPHLPTTGPSPAAAVPPDVMCAHDELGLAFGIAPPTQSSRLAGALPSAWQIAT